MNHTFFGIQNAADSAYGLATALSYWVFKCRDRAKSPAMGTKTWTFLERIFEKYQLAHSDPDRRKGFLGIRLRVTNTVAPWKP
jgi:hypothetical protein